jgi:hypothetical protein
MLLHTRFMFLVVKLNLFLIFLLANQTRMLLPALLSSYYLCGTIESLARSPKSGGIKYRHGNKFTTNYSSPHQTILAVVSVNDGAVDPPNLAPGTSTTIVHADSAPLSMLDFVGDLFLSYSANATTMADSGIMTTRTHATRYFHLRRFLVGVSCVSRTSGTVSSSPSSPSRASAGPGSP